MEDELVKVLDMNSYKERMGQKVTSLNLALKVRSSGVDGIDTEQLDSFINEMLEDISQLRRTFDNCDVITFGDDANVRV